MKPAELKNIRIKMGLTQKQFGDVLGFSREKYIQIETGKRKIDYALELLIREKTSSVINPHKTKDNVTTEPDPVYELKKMQVGHIADSMAIMTNTSTSLVSLDLLCEVLSCVSNQKLEDVKARAKTMLRERGQSLQLVLEAVF